MRFVLDLDGTLIDSSARHYVLMEKIIEENRQQGKINPALLFSADSYMQYKRDGNSGKQYLSGELGIDSVLAAGLQKQWTQQIESEELLQLDTLYPDTMEFLDKISTGRNQIVYLTARQSESLVRKEIERLGIAAYADKVVVVSPANAWEGKLQAVKNLLAPERKEKSLAGAELPHCRKEKPLADAELPSGGKEMILVGDTENEYEIGRKLFLPVFLLNRGFRSAAYWERHSVVSYPDLKSIYENIRRAGK